MLVGRPGLTFFFFKKKKTTKNLKTIDNIFSPKCFLNCNGISVCLFVSFKLSYYWPYNKWLLFTTLEVVVMDTFNAYDREVGETVSIRHTNVSINCLNLSSDFFTDRWGLWNVKSFNNIWYLDRSGKNKTLIKVTPGVNWPYGVPGNARWAATLVWAGNNKRWKKKLLGSHGLLRVILALNGPPNCSPALIL